jgi:hypothetical protein
VWFYFRLRFSGKEVLQSVHQSSAIAADKDALHAVFLRFCARHADCLLGDVSLLFRGDFLQRSLRSKPSQLEADNTDERKKHLRTASEGPELFFIQN